MEVHGPEYSLQRGLTLESYERQDPEWVRRGIKVTSFPRVYLLKADGKTVASEFQGDRTVERLHEWVQSVSL